MKLIAALLLTAVASYAQMFTVHKATSLSGSAEVITIQQPTSGSRILRGEFASIYSSADCEVQLEHSGTAATATTLTINKVDPRSRSSAFVAFSGSNVGAGTVFAHQIVKGGSTFVFDLSRMILRGDFDATNNLANFTLRTDSCTATVIVNIGMREE